MAVALAAAAKNLPTGKAVKGKICKTLTTGSILTCADNSGAKELMIIGVKEYKGVRSRLPRAGIGDLVVASVRAGKPELRKTIVKAVVVRQKKSYRRPDGMHIMFEDNAAVIINDDGIPKGSEIKGVVAKEVAEKWHKISSIAGGVV